MAFIEIEFYGINFVINDKVLHPRLKTETTVAVAASLISRLTKKNRKRLSVVDIGTGSGIIIIALAIQFAKFDNIDFYGTDISSEALKVAGFNASRHEIAKKISFFQGDLMSCLPKAIQPDVIVANLPYTPIGKKNLDDIYEPPEAVFDEGNGTRISSRLMEQISQTSAMPRGLILETAPELMEPLIIIASNTFKVVPKSFVYPNHDNRNRVIEFLW